MKKFMDADFLLDTETARHLFHDYAKQMPIIDYHCHISPQEIAEDHRFKSITEVWLGGDHYKWRLIRSNGTPEEKITGKESTDLEKFIEYAKALPRAIGNPLYHWSHLELQRYFGITEPLNEKNAEKIFNQCNEKLKEADMGVQGLIKQSNVKVICTTDDPADDLKWHQKLAAEKTCSAKVYPAMRPDKLLNIDKAGYSAYMQHLGEAAGVTIRNFADICDAMGKRIQFFESMGCRATDHALEYVFCRQADEASVNAIIAKGLKGQAVTTEEAEAYKTAVLTYLAGEYAKRDWVMQIHYATLRDNNTKMFKKLGPDTGFDCIAEGNCGKGLVAFLDHLEQRGILPRTVLYSGTPADNALIGTIIGSFQGPEARGKIQQGAAWWFNDTKSGMIDQMTSIANLSVFGNILGMLTDSRSFLSYARHEYYRRILCNWIGNLVESGEYPNDDDMLKQLVQDICFNNVENYFQFKL
ncbi:MAG: glucuronate isomerase [Megasphaera sp.]|jgi:glucuronate isomerase|nr:glucuronate isomerase [Megasphaera sp.]MCH4218163.1 glucuronate isomerase [Megasphaera sp.]